MNKFTTSYFIKKAVSIHGENYDYSKVFYVNSQDVVTIICKKHGEFRQRANSHLRGAGCKFCGLEKQRRPLGSKLFIEKARKIHGDEYDYPNILYSNNVIKIEIMCHIHGAFFQRPANHLKGAGCQKCAREKLTSNQVCSTEEFIIKAKKRHGNCYDYSAVTYVNNHSKITILCKKHGAFLQIPSNHLSGSGCHLCGLEKMNRSSNTEDFIKKAHGVHGNRYDYSKVLYINNTSKITIICRKHGEFEQRPHNHLMGKGCKLCKNEKLSYDRSITTEEFIEKAERIHHHKYEYHLVDYVNAQTFVTIVCPYHGLFDQLPFAHLQGHGCSKCSHKELSRIFSGSIQKFIKKANQIHNNEYEYNVVTYINARTKVKIICKKHGEFEQTPNKHLMGQGCPHCSESAGEKAVRRYLDSCSILFIPQKTFADCRNIHPLEFDFFLPEYNTLIEFDGIQHFIPVRFHKSVTNEKLAHSFEQIKRCDSKKNFYCKENGKRLLRISYKEIHKIPELINNFLHQSKEVCDAPVCSN
jgi:hypothetical protein